MKTYNNFFLSDYKMWVFSATGTYKLNCIKLNDHIYSSSVDDVSYSAV